MELDMFQLFDVFSKEVRSILEMAVPVWHSSITKQQTAEIESVQKVAMKILLGSRYKDYKSACDLLRTESLQNRRIKLCHKYAMKNLKSEHSFFKKVGTNLHTRQKSNTRLESSSAKLSRDKLP